MLTTALLTYGCASGNSDVEAAQIAVRANPALELVATDAEQGLLTVRVKASKQVLTARVADVVAGTAFQTLDLSSGAAASTASAATTSRTPTEQPAGGTSVSASRTTDARRDGQGRVERQATVDAGGVRVDARTSEAAGSEGKRARVTLPGGMVIDAERGDAGSRARVSQPGPASQPSTVSQQPPPPPQQESPRVSPSAGDKGPMLEDSRLERRSGPFTCDGGTRVLDGVLFDASAGPITVLKSCRLTIRGSRVTGGSPAIVVQDAGILIVDGSIVDARATGVAVRLNDAARGQLRNSRFVGRVAKDGGAMMVDEGGNLWK